MADEGPYRTLARTGVTVAVDTGFANMVREGCIRVVPQIDSFTRVLRPNGRPIADDHGRSSERGLWFIGFTTSIEGTLRRHGIEARGIARALRGI